MTGHMHGGMAVVSVQCCWVLCQYDVAHGIIVLDLACLGRLEASRLLP
jgi:hypothetical protein